METTGKGAFSIIAAQGAAIAVSALVMMLWGSQSSSSMVLGGVVAILPNAFFAWASTRRRPGGWLLVQGVVKFLLWVVLMTIAFKGFSPDPLVFFFWRDRGLAGARDRRLLVAESESVPG